jgi:hypothetical protein
VIEHGNAASVRVAERLGMVGDGETTVSGQPVHIYAIQRPRAARRPA